MSQLQSALMRLPRVKVHLSTFVVSSVLIIGCDRAGEKGSADSGFVEARVDTITVRDTIVVVDTVFVEKVVEKKVEVPAEIPPLHEHALQKLVAEVGAEFADEKTCFSGLGGIEVSVGMDEDAEEILSKQRAKDKFELTLRRYDVPLSDSSNPYLALDIQALWNEEKTFAVYTMSVSLIEPLIFYRDNKPSRKPHRRYVALWEKANFGFAGKNVAREAFLRYIEENAERVANLYLSAN